MPLEYEAIRNSFNAIAHQYEKNAVLQKEVLLRLLERLEDEKNINSELTPSQILELGCGTGWSIPEFVKMFPEVDIVALDFSQLMLNQIPPSLNVTKVLGDVHSLPIDNESTDLVFSNMLLHWSNEKDVFSECYRVLKPGGIILMSTLGETSLYELKQAWESVDAQAHVHEFPALHDLGDDLLKTGFEQVIVNTEVITLTYQDVIALMKDIKSSGGHNSNEGRSKGLMSSKQLKKLERGYEVFRQDDRLPASYEIVYLRAIKPK